MSQLKVNSISDSAGANGNAITLASDGSCIVKATNSLSNRNLIINGGCVVNQYGSTSTSNGIKTLDRWYASWSGTSTAITQTAHDLTSSDTGPWEKGFKRSFHLARTAGSSDADNYANIRYLVEAQDIVNSGWLHTSTSSKMTLSFWVKSSLAGTYGVTVRTKDGTNKVYATTYTLSANTWKKVSMTFPGASNITLNNDNGAGFDINIAAHWGTDFTVSSGFSYETWNTFVGSSRYNDFPQDWISTSNATFEVTGLQLEVGDVATDFEHRSYGDELRRCQRYFQQIGATGQDGTYTVNAAYLYDNGNKVATGYNPPVPFRATPTMTNGSTYLTVRSASTSTDVNSYNFIEVVAPSTWISISGVLHTDAGNDGDLAVWTCPSNGLVQMSAEL
tara:strand:+ start:1454 stop:2626 length:1173 start_codon:yes stop_codon:yes gene_type:complete